MGFLKNLIAGGPKYLNQDLFNTIVFKTYARFRPQFEDFDTFWKGSETLANRTVVKTQDLFRKYLELYNKDDLISAQFGAATFLLEKHLDSDLGHNILSWQLVDLVAKLSDDLDPNGEKIISTIHVNAPNHPSPEQRPQQLVLDFIKYTNLVNERITKK
jgi:hypothetical protein